MQPLPHFEDDPFATGGQANFRYSWETKIEGRRRRNTSSSIYEGRFDFTLGGAYYAVAGPKLSLHLSKHASIDVGDVWGIGLNGQENFERGKFSAGATFKF